MTSVSIHPSVDSGCARGGAKSFQVGALECHCASDKMTVPTCRRIRWMACARINALGPILHDCLSPGLMDALATNAERKKGLLH